MSSRRNAILAHRDAARFRDLGADLGRRQHASVAGFGPLTEFQLDHFDLGIGRLGCEFVGIETAFVGPAAKIPRSNLINQISAALSVITANSTFARIVRKPACLRACVLGFDGICREGAKTHCRDVVERGGIKLLAVGAAHCHPKVCILDVDGHDRMGDPLIP